MPLDRNALATDAILAPPRSRDLFRSLDDAAAARLVRRFIAVLDVDRLAGRIGW